MNISYFSTFLTVLEAGNFSAAAKQLNISQPAVSFQMQALEKYLGAPLFDRAGHDLKLTGEGETALPYIRALVRDTDSLQTALTDLRSTVSGALRISASTIPGEYVAPRLMAEFTHLYPLVKMTLKVGDSAAAAEDVMSGRAEVGFVGSMPAKGNKSLKTLKVADDALVLIAPAGQNGPVLKPLKLNDLTGLPLILREPGSGSRRIFEAALEQIGRKTADFGAGLELDNNQAILSAVAAGLGFSAISALAAEPSLKQGTVIAVAAPELKLSRPLYLIYDGARTPSRAAAAFIALAAD
jgi:DNA-binding transcriptional LysR family regulator